MLKHDGVFVLDGSGVCDVSIAARWAGNTQLQILYEKRDFYTKKKRTKKTTNKLNRLDLEKLF